MGVLDGKVALITGAGGGLGGSLRQAVCARRLRLRPLDGAKGRRGDQGVGPDGIAPAVLYMVSDLSGDQTGKVLGVSGPRGVREMRMMEMEGWKPPFTGWKAEDIVTHANEIFFSEEEIKNSARRF
jgi:hypothetical protein